MKTVTQTSKPIIMTPEKVDIVIPYGRAYIPENQNFALPDPDGELMFCLRSIEKHLKNVGTVYVIGSRFPSWLQKAHTLYQEDSTGANNASFNIYSKLLRFSSKQLGSKNFLYVNDDHFLLKDFDAANFPYYFEGTFGARTPPHTRITSYRRTMNNTIQQLGPSAPYYDIHCPLLINKEKFLKLQSYNWKVPAGMCIKTMYCNIANVTGVETVDFKIPSVQSMEWLNANFAGKEFFSTDNNCFGRSMTAKMYELYPKKSTFER